jgi:hypothetical protein
LSSREAQLAEELTQAVKRRDADALEEARAPDGRNRSALANLDPAFRDLVGQIRVSVRVFSLEFGCARGPHPFLGGGSVLF